MARLFADLPAARRRARPSSPAASTSPSPTSATASPSIPLPPGETPPLVPAPPRLERRPRPLPAAHRQGPGADRERARPDREARPRRLLPDRLGHRPLLPSRTASSPRAAARRPTARSATRSSITAVDPVKMELLFERFLSEERGEWPDIDLDLPSGDQREKVIQYVYKRYGAARRGDDRQRHHLPRPLGDARGGQGLRLSRPSRSTAWPSSSAAGAGDLSRRRGEVVPGRAQAPPASIPRSRACGTSRALWRAHPEPAPPPRPALGRHGDRRRPARRGGAARARRHARPRGGAVGQGRLRRPRDHQGRPARPRHARRARRDGPDRPHPRGHRRSISPTCRRTTRRSTRCSARPTPSGVFQVESRAQMAALPAQRAAQSSTTWWSRSAIIRPGPIVGGMANPFFERRAGRQPVDLLPPQPRADPRSAPSACRSSRSSCCASPWWRRASPAARPRSCAAPWASSARSSACRRSRRGCARGMTANGHRRRRRRSRSSSRSPPSRSTASPSRTPRASR